VIAESPAQAVHLVGLGAQTPLGKAAPPSAAAVRAGFSNGKLHPYMTHAAGEPMRVASAPWLSADLPLAARISALASGAVREAVAALVLLARSARRSPSLAVVIGVSDRPGLPGDFRAVLSASVLDPLRDLWPEAPVAFEVGGHAAGALALARGCQLLRDGACAFCLVGGADSHLGPENLRRLDDQGRVLGPNSSWGCIPGEGSGFCLLTLAATREQHELASLLELVSVADAREPNTLHSRGVCTGAGLSQAVAEVLRACPADKVSTIVSDLNGETHRADEFGFTLLRHAQRFPAPPVFHTPAAAWGDVGAASAPLFASLIAAAAQRGYARGEYSVLLTSSDAEERAAVLVRTGSTAGE
jgi:3-oxoacyl-[acyl-carrier-protein] synthase I